MNLNHRFLVSAVKSQGLGRALIILDSKTDLAEGKPSTTWRGDRNGGQQEQNLVEE